MILIIFIKYACIISIDRSELKDCFDVLFTWKLDGKIMLMQPHLIDTTIAILELDKDTIKKMNDTPDRLD